MVEQRKLIKLSNRAVGSFKFYELLTIIIFINTHVWLVCKSFELISKTSVKSPTSILPAECPRQPTIGYHEIRGMITSRKRFSQNP